MERTHRSLLVGMRARLAEGEAAGARYGLFVSLAGGLEQLVERLLGRLDEGDLRLQEPPSRPARATGRRLAADNARWRGAGRPGGAGAAGAGGGAAAGTTRAPSKPGARGHPPRLGRDLPPARYRAEDRPPLRVAAGVGVAAVRARTVIAASLVGRKLPLRAPEGCHLVRAFVGGALGQEAWALSDQELAARAHQDCADFLHLRAGPLQAQVARYPQAMPQYTLGHAQRVAAVREALAGLPSLGLVCNAVDGIGIGALCARAEEIAASARAPSARS